MMLRTVFLILLLLPQTVYGAGEMCSCSTKEGFSFFYEEAQVADYPEGWSEIYYFEVNSVTKAMSLYSDETPNCIMSVTPIPDGSQAADLIDLDHAEDGLLFGGQWLSFEEFESIMIDTGCSVATS